VANVSTSGRREAVAVVTGGTDPDLEGIGVIVPTVAGKAVGSLVVIDDAVIDVVMGSTGPSAMAGCADIVGIGFASPTRCAIVLIIGVEAEVGQVIEEDVRSELARRRRIVTDLLGLRRPDHLDVGTAMDIVASNTLLALMSVDVLSSDGCSIG